MVSKMSWAERITPRGNLVLVSFKVDQAIALPGTTSQVELAPTFKVLKVGPGRRNPETGVYLPIEIEPGKPLERGDEIMGDPNAVMIQERWKDESIGLIPDSSIWCQVEPDANDALPQPKLHRVQ